MLTKYARYSRRLPSWLLRPAAAWWYDAEYPRHLFIETTAACNLHCTYCPREARAQSMDFSLFKALITEATQFGPRSFSLHLFGEPLLYPHWEEAVAYIRCAHPSHTILFTTNGTLLNTCVDVLTSSAVDLCLWTWRPEAQFTPHTKAKLKRWGKFLVRFIDEITPASALREWGNWRPQEHKHLHNYGGTIDLAPFGSRPGSRMSRYPCYHLWYAPAVAWNGDILMCCNDPHHREVLGHFPEQSVHEVWTGARMTQLRQSHLDRQYGGICASCNVWQTYPDIVPRHP